MDTPYKTLDVLHRDMFTTYFTCVKDECMQGKWTLYTGETPVLLEVCKFADPHKYYRYKFYKMSFHQKIPYKQ